MDRNLLASPRPVGIYCRLVPAVQRVIRKLSRLFLEVEFDP